MSKLKFNEKVVKFTDKKLQRVVYMDSEEYWEDICCYDIRENMYEISTFGNVRNKLTKQILKQQYINTGYLVVSLRCNGIYRDSAHFLVHRLMGFTFLMDQKTKDQTEINHIRSKYSGNHLNNIEWVSPEENENHKNKYIQPKGEKVHNSILTDEQANIACEMIRDGYSYSEILLELGLEDTPNGRDMIGNIKRGISWVHISKDYDFSNTKYYCTKYTLEEIKTMCKLLEEKKSFKEIYETLYPDKTYIGSRENKSYYEFIRKLKNKETLKEITKDYNF